VGPTLAKACCPDSVNEELGICRAFREKKYQVYNTHIHTQPSELPGKPKELTCGDEGWRD